MTTLDGNQVGKPDTDAGRADVDPVIRTITRRLLPLLFAGAVLAQLDRVNVSMASLTMNREVGISPATYGFAVGAFFIVYAVLEIPSNWGLARFGARVWIARIMVSWGLVSAATVLVAGPGTFIANRVVLAAAEAGFLPGVLVYLSAWLPARARGRAFAIFLMAIPIANILGGPLAAGILKLDGSLGLRGWQWLFLIEGLPPTLLSVAIWRGLPDGPEDAAWLDPAQRLAVRRWTEPLRPRAHLTFRSFAAAIAQPKVFLFTAVLGCLGGVNHAVTFWLPQIVKGMGLSATETGFAVAVPYLFGAAAMVWWSSHSDRTGERRWHLAGPAMTAGLALAASALVPVDGVRMTLVVVAVTCVLALQGTFWSAVSTAFDADDRAIGMATVSAGGILFAFAAPSMIGLSKQWTGSFDGAFGILGILGVAGGGLALVMTRFIPGTQRGLEQLTGEAP